MLHDYVDLYMIMAYMLLPIPIMVITVMSLLPGDNRLLWMLMYHIIGIGTIVVLAMLPPLLRYFTEIHTTKLILIVMLVGAMIVGLGYNAMSSTSVVIVNGIVLALNAGLVIKSEVEAINYHISADQDE